MPYEVQTPVYEGPFDLLLHLILRDQVDIYEISLVDVVDAFLAELDRLPEVDLDVATQFLLIAATLVELKSRRLIPGDGDVEADEEVALWEERDLFLARLLECKTFKDAAAALQRLSASAGRSHPRRAGLEERFVSLAPDPLEGVAPAKLRDSFLRAVAARPQPRVDLDHVAPVRASVRDALDELARELPGAGPVTFRRLTEAATERLEVVVRFLAVLELYKQGLVELEQATTFGEIVVSWRANGMDGTYGTEGPLDLGYVLQESDTYDG